MSLRIFRHTKIFLPVNASLHWLNNVSCLVLSFLQITPGVYFCIVFFKVVRLAACVALRVVGAVFVILLRRWRTIYINVHSPQPMGSKRRYLREMSQTLLTNKKQENLD
jgi:hypothetical protein